MNIKRFFQPTPAKIILFVLVFWYAAAYIANPQLGTVCSYCGCYNTWGFPIKFYQDIVVGQNFFDLSRPFSCGTIVPTRNYLALVFDAIIWSLISLSIIYVITLKYKHPSTR